MLADRLKGSPLPLDDGSTNASGFAENMPPLLVTWVQDAHDEYAIPVMSLPMTLGPQLAWAVRASEPMHARP